MTTTTTTIKSPFDTSGPSSFTGHEFNGVNHNKSQQAIVRRDSGGIPEPFEGVVSGLHAIKDRSCTAYSKATLNTQRRNGGTKNAK